MITGRELRKKYLDFFTAKGHVVIPSAPIVLNGDPTTLFTGSGMQPMMPYLLGAAHPLGKRLTDSQKSFRAGDIDEVGDNRHTTFFEMLGNWSLGDYFKKEQLTWFYEFLTKEIGLDKNKLHVSVFEGIDNIEKDKESYQIWKDLGIIDDHIHFYGVRKNWWARNGAIPATMPKGEPGGPDSEVFYDFGTPHDPAFGEVCHPNCDCGRFMEIGNSVFMLYQKQEDGSLKELSQKNVDFGGGLERILAVANDDPDVFKTDLFTPIIIKLEELTGASYKKNPRSMRIIADHLKGSVMMASEGLEPSNKQQGYVLRRFLRRTAVKMKELNPNLINEFKNLVRAIYDIYPNYLTNDSFEKVVSVINTEMNKFQKTLDRGLHEIDKTRNDDINSIFAFNLFQSFGFPFEITKELAAKKGVNLSDVEFAKLMTEHQNSSRTSSAGMFKGGLADQSEITTKYHTATHLLHQALRDVLGDHVHQAGSNITSDRLRFDFTHDKALSPDELTKVEQIINQKIQENLPVVKENLPYQEAIDSGALAFFKEKYPQMVTVYSIGDYSKELCGGPHVTSTLEIGNMKVVKQESLGSSLRRIYLQLDLQDAS